MITIIPALEIMRSVTDKNISGDGAEKRRNAFTLAVELKSLADIKLLLEGILYDKIKERIEEASQGVFFQSTCSIDNSAKGLASYNIVRAINWIAESESKNGKVIILTENPSMYSEIKTENVKVLTPSDFILISQKVVDLAKKRESLSLDEILLALFFL